MTNYLLVTCPVFMQRGVPFSNPGPSWRLIESLQQKEWQTAAVTWQWLHGLSKLFMSCWANREASKGAGSQHGADSPEAGGTGRAQRAGGRGRVRWECRDWRWEGLDSYRLEHNPAFPNHETTDKHPRGSCQLNAFSKAGAVFVAGAETVLDGSPRIDGEGTPTGPASNPHLNADECVLVKVELLNWRKKLYFR